MSKSNKADVDFSAAAKETFNTESGKRFLKYLRDRHVTESAIMANVHGVFDTNLTLMRLAVKEHVQELITFVEGGDDAISKVEIVEETYNTDSVL